MPTFRARIAVVVFASIFATERSFAQSTYLRADVDRQGVLHITMSNAREIVPRKDTDQVAFDKPAISADHHAVGWLALYPNCCTTYPIPLELVVLTDGRRRTFARNDLPVWRWSFSGDGKRVALQQSPVHGYAPRHFELRDVRTGRLVSRYTAYPDKPGDPPAWVRALDSIP